MNVAHVEGEIYLLGYDQVSGPAVGRARVGAVHVGQEIHVTEQQHSFSLRSASYAKSRPQYPSALYAWIASQCDATWAAWDCATGNGQAAVGLAEHFSVVHATDSSQEQIQHAIPHSGVRYQRAPAETAGFPDEAFDLVTVAQALHWFDYSRFWPEVSRVLRPNGLFCAWGYAWLTTTPLVDETLVKPLRKALEPFWAPNNRLLWSGYQSQDISFPYDRIQAPEFAIVVEWSLRQLLDYFETWSAFKQSRTDPSAVRAIEQIVAAVLAEVGSDTPLTVKMPLSIVAGRKQRGLTGSKLDSHRF